MNTIFLVDGANFLFRAYHALPPMTTKAGVHTGAVFGFVNMLLRLQQEHRPSHFAVIFDAGGRSPRTELYAQYKANRPECPPDLSEQFDLSRRLLPALGVPVLDARDVEADDLIATLARKARKDGLRVVIVSSDKDLMQLCGDDIALLDTMKEGGKGLLYTPAEVEQKFGVGPEQLGDVLALMGDSVDNVPGVPGVGPKTASQLVRDHGSLEALLKHVESNAPLAGIRGADKIKAALKAHLDDVRLSRRLVTLDESVPIPGGLGLEALAAAEPDLAALEPMLQELEFNRLLAKLRPQGGTAGSATQPGGGAGAGGPAPVSAAGPEDGPLLALLQPVVADAATLAERVAALRADAAAAGGLALSVQLAGSSQGARVAPVCGLALYAPPGPPLYVPLTHRYLGAPPQLPLAQVQAALRPLLADPALPKFVYGVKDAHLALESLGLQLHGVRSDPALCSYLIDAGRDHELGALVQRHLRREAGAPPLPRDRAALCQSGKRAVPLESVEVELVAALAGYEAQATLLLGQSLRARLDEPAQKLLEQMELPLGLVLARIERHGVLLDTGVLRQLSVEVDERMRALEAEVQRQAGYEVNIGSPKQLQELLFEKLGLEPVKKTKTGLSTDAEVLEQLAEQNPIAKTIHEHRILAKLKNTYIDQLPLLVDARTGRLHTSYNQVVAATGRLSSSEPNLQNIPIRTELGRQIRRAFVAPRGAVLIAADYSQIELRVMAHLSRDPLLLSSFQKGEDVHERTALEMFGPEQGRKPESRRAAKMINYGIIYGLTDYGLATRLSIEKSVAKLYIKEYFARYSGVRQYMDHLVEQARREGGARTLLGRFRPLPELQTRNYQARSYGERMAKNTPLQGTAADILKQAMIDVQGLLDSRPELETRMLLTVHDELVLEAPEAHKDAAAKLVKEAMERAYKLEVPLQVDVGVGSNWADCD